MHIKHPREAALLRGPIQVAQLEIQAPTSFGAKCLNEKKGTKIGIRRLDCHSTKKWLNSPVEEL
jgi:hypothetical protein